MFLNISNSTQPFRNFAKQSEGGFANQLPKIKIMMNTKNHPTFITLINDSKDDNAIARQETRWASLFPNVQISFIGVDSNLGDNATLQAAGNLIDILDAGEGKSGIIAVNVAPRGQKNVDGENGSPFAYFWHKKTLVISTIKAYNLSLVKKLKLVDHINLLNTKKVLDFALANNLIAKQLHNHISNTQFRSFDFQPRAAMWIFENIKVPSTKLSLNKIPNAPRAIWHIDSFGNYKTTISSIDINRHFERAARVEKSHKRINTNLGTLPYYNRLKDIPPGQTAIYTGSSGIEDNRFLEFAKQNSAGSAHKQLRQKIGSKIKVV